MSAPPLDPNGVGDLIFDWNEVERKVPLPAAPFALVDETLRDGLQNPSVEDPPVAEKLRILQLMADVGIEVANVGLPGSGQRAFDDALTMCREVVTRRLNIKLAAAARTVVADVEPIIEISQRAGIPLEAYLFIGSSPIRQYVEQSDVALIASRSGAAIDTAVKAGLQVAYVTEDTTRSRPEVLKTLFVAAIERGATRICLSDTVGHATPDGVRNLVTFAKRVIAESGAAIGVDWHGHNDRGLALENGLFALECGVDRVHGTALGIGERVGNTPMELLLLNLRLLGQLPETRDLTRLVEYCETVASAVRWQIPPNYPLVGKNAFRTATGVHAAAIVKAMKRSGAWLADRVYSAVPAGMFGRHQEICIGFMSGASNVGYWLRERGIEPRDELVDAILRAAKATTHILSDQEVMDIVTSVQA